MFYLRIAEPIVWLVLSDSGQSNPQKSQMRLSIDPLPDRLTEVVRIMTNRWNRGVRGSFHPSCLLLWCLFALQGGSSDLVAQPPGTQPPQRLLSSGQDSSDEGVPIRAFMFLSESGNPVMMPSMTWEEFERYLNLDSGRETSGRKYNYQSLEVTGSATGTRAELQLRLRLVIDPTEGGWINIPIKLGNFHQIEPISLEPSIEAITSVSSDGSGYRLFVRHSSKVEADLLMRVSARVEVSGNSRSLRFQFPDVPTRVQLAVGNDTANAEVVGQGDEIVNVLNSDPDKVELKVESSGGDYALRWGPDSETVQKASIFEIDSRTSVRWNSPEDQPIASVRLSVNNLRGSVESFLLSLPENAVLLDNPAIADSGQFLEVGPSQSGGKENLREITVPTEMRQQRLELAFEFQLGSQQASSESPLQFLVPQVKGAIRHRGEVEVIVPSEYRLRWITSPSIRRTFLNTADLTGPERSYRFIFERPEFVLPLWLGANQRQLRLNSRAELTTRDNNATLWIQVEISGQTTDGLLRFDAAGWEVRVVESQLGTPLVTFAEDNLSVVDISSVTNEEASQLILQFQKILGDSADGAPVELDIPRVIVPNKGQVIRDSELKLINDGRRAFVVDLEASRGLNRTTTVEDVAASNSEITSYRMIDGEASTRIVGSLIEQPTRITLASDVSVELDGDSLNTNCDWIVSTLLDLEGRLVIRIPFLSGVSRVVDQTEEVGDQNASEPIAAEAGASGWNVTVDEFPAQLKYIADEQYELISDRLTNGTMRIRLQSRQLTEQISSDDGMLTLSLPRPSVADTALRGPVVVSVQGDGTRDLVAVESPQGEQLELTQIPKDPIRLLIKNEEEGGSDLEVGTTVVRSLVGSSTRFDQILARVKGGEVFELNLLADPSRVTVTGTVDGEPVGVRLDGSKLIVPLANRRTEQLVDLRVWFPQQSTSIANQLAPLVHAVDPPMGSYWQIITPRDSHIVWASTLLNREMAWRYDRWKFYRDPSYGDQDLLEMVSGKTDPMPDGNRYLYRGYEVSAFNVLILSRVTIWMIVGSIVILLTIAVTTSKAFRHPAMMTMLLTGLAGFGIVAPDGVILAGQYCLFSLILVVVMFAVKVLLQPDSRRRLFSDTRASVHTNDAPKGSKSHSIQTVELVAGQDDSVDEAGA